MKRSLFTLIELLVVIAIIAILASILMPALSSARERGRAATCINNQKSLGLANMQYQEDFGGWYIPSYMADANARGVDSTIGNPAPRASANQSWTWPFYIALHSKVTSGFKPLGYIKYDISRSTTAKGMLCPSDKNNYRTLSYVEGNRNQCYVSYAINAFLGGNYAASGAATTNGLWMNNSNWGHHEIKKKPSQTPMFVDRDNYRSSGSRYFIWGHKTNSSLDPGMPENWVLSEDPAVQSPGQAGARHSGSISTCFADGHAKLIQTPIANSHTSGKRLFWADPSSLDRAELN